MAITLADTKRVLERMRKRLAAAHRAANRAEERAYEAQKYADALASDLAAAERSAAVLDKMSLRRPLTFRGRPFKHLGGQVFIRKRGARKASVLEAIMWLDTRERGGLEMKQVEAAKRRRENGK